MNLDEAIKHREEVKECLEKMQFKECVEEQKQLVEWLKDYKRLLEQESFKPKLETVTEFADRCKECGREKILDKIIMDIEKLPTRIYLDRSLPDINYQEIEYVDVTKKELLGIVNKYRVKK